MPTAALVNMLPSNQTTAKFGFSSKDHFKQAVSGTNIEREFPLPT